MDRISVAFQQSVRKTSKQHPFSFYCLSWHVSQCSPCPRLPSQKPSPHRRLVPFLPRSSPVRSLSVSKLAERYTRAVVSLAPKGPRTGMVGFDGASADVLLDRQIGPAGQAVDGVQIRPVGDTLRAPRCCAFGRKSFRLRLGPGPRGHRYGGWVSGRLRDRPFAFERRAAEQGRAFHRPIAVPVRTLLARRSFRLLVEFHSRWCRQ